MSETIHMHDHIQRLNSIIQLATEELAIIAETMREQEEAKLSHVEQVPEFLKKSNPIELDMQKQTITISLEQYEELKNLDAWVKFDDAMPTQDGDYIVLLHISFRKGIHIMTLKEIINSNRFNFSAWLKLPEFNNERK